MYSKTMRAEEKKKKRERAEAKKKIFFFKLVLHDSFKNFDLRYQQGAGRQGKFNEFKLERTLGPL